MQKFNLQNSDVKRLDFSKPRLRVNGKSVDKFSVARLIDGVKCVNACICMDVFSYDELKNWLKQVLVERNFRGIYGEIYVIVA